MAIIGFASRVAYKVYSGDGLETYHSVSLVQWNYVGVLVFLVSVPVAWILFRVYFSLEEKSAFRKWKAALKESRANRASKNRDT